MPCVHFVSTNYICYYLFRLKMAVLTSESAVQYLGLAHTKPNQKPSKRNLSTKLTRTRLREVTRRGVFSSLVWRSFLSRTLKIAALKFLLRLSLWKIQLSKDTHRIWNPSNSSPSLMRLTSTLSSSKLTSRRISVHHCVPQKWNLFMFCRLFLSCWYWLGKKW